MEKQFTIRVMYKQELARAYGISIFTLRKWLMLNKPLWKKLNYDEAHSLTINKVKAIIEHLGEPGTIN